MAYNIIFYFSDQQRWDTCGCFGQPLNVTPNLDKLAEEGVKFDNAFSPQPVCGPCRALFQTGKYPTETGCFRNNLMLPSNIKTLGEYMEKDAGYETAYVGKWHLASDGELEKKPTIDHPDKCHWSGCCGTQRYCAAWNAPFPERTGRNPTRQESVRRPETENGRCRLPLWLQKPFQPVLLPFHGKAVPYFCRLGCWKHRHKSSTGNADCTGWTLA